MARRRPGPRAGKIGRLSGPDIPFDTELEYDRDRPHPTPIFPDYEPAKPKPLIDIERREVQHFLGFQEDIRNSPLYAYLDRNAFLPDYDVDGEDDEVALVNVGVAGARRDPFHSSMAKFSQRYRVSKRTLPTFDHREHNLQFFPRELWATLDPRYRVNKKLGRPGAGARLRKVLSQSDSAQMQSRNGVLYAFRNKGKDREEDDVLDQEVSGIEEGAGKDLEERRAGQAIGPRGEGGEDLEDEDDLDDEFDDEEEAGDYDAEQYFDDGGEDGGDDGDQGRETSGYFE